MWDEAVQLSVVMIDFNISIIQSKYNYYSLNTKLFTVSKQLYLTQSQFN